MAANQGARKMKVKQGKQGTVSKGKAKIKSGSAMPIGRVLLDSVNENDKDQQKRKGKGKAETCTIQEFYEKKRFVKLAHACCRFRDIADRCEKTAFNEGLVNVFQRLLDAQFCHFCLERSNGAVMGMLNETFHILKNHDHDTAGCDDFELKQSAMTIANLKEINNQLQNSFTNVLKQKTDLERLADKLSGQIQDLEGKHGSCTDKLGSSVQNNNEACREHMITQEYEALKKPSQRAEQAH